MISDLPSGNIANCYRDNRDLKIGKSLGQRMTNILSIVSIRTSSCDILREKFLGGADQWINTPMFQH
jgi:hypothetical protein